MLIYDNTELSNIITKYKLFTRGVPIYLGYSGYYSFWYFGRTNGTFDWNIVAMNCGSCLRKSDLSGSICRLSLFCVPQESNNPVELRSSVLLLWAGILILARTVPCKCPCFFSHLRKSLPFGLRDLRLRFKLPVPSKLAHENVRAKKNGEVGIWTRGPGHPSQLLSRQLHSTTLPPLQNLDFSMICVFYRWEIM